MNNLSDHSNNNDDNQHDSVWKLIPWFINDTLELNEQRQVELHIKECNLCNDEYHAQLLIKKSLITNDNVSINNVVTFEKLMHRIDVEKNKTHKNTIFPPVTDILQYTRKIKYRTISSALAASVIIFSSLGIFYTNTNNTIIYSTLTDSQEQSVYTSDISNQNTSARKYLTRVIFTKSTSNKNIQALIKKYQGIIINGPDERGIYTVDFANSISNSQQYNVVLSQLKSQPEILLVAAIFKNTNTK